MKNRKFYFLMNRVTFYIFVPCFGLISTDLPWVLCTTKTLPYINKFLNKITGKISGAPLSCIQIRNWFLLRHYLFLLFKHRVSVVIYISMNIGVVLHLDFFVKVLLILYSIFHLHLLVIRSFLLLLLSLG